jgi:hypothetical protein
MLVIQLLVTTAHSKLFKASIHSLRAAAQIFGLQPVHIICTDHLAESTCKCFATACAAYKGNPLLWEAMRVIVELSMGCQKVWCARPAWFLKCIGALSREEIDICNLPDSNIVAQAVLHWAGSCRQQLLHATV